MSQRWAIVNGVYSNEILYNENRILVANSLWHYTDWECALMTNTCSIRFSDISERKQTNGRMDMFLFNMHALLCKNQHLKNYVYFCTCYVFFLKFCSTGSRQRALFRSKGEEKNRTNSIGYRRFVISSAHALFVDDDDELSMSAKSAQASGQASKRDRPKERTWIICINQTPYILNLNSIKMKSSIKFGWHLKYWHILNSLTCYGLHHFWWSYHKERGRRGRRKKCSLRKIQFE